MNPRTWFGQQRRMGHSGCALTTDKIEHKEHLKAILEFLKKEKLYAKFSKCEFWIPKVQYLGHVIDSRGKAHYGGNVDHLNVGPKFGEVSTDWSRNDPRNNGKDCLIKPEDFKLLAGGSDKRAT
ncbi:hypothetical protein Tco_1215126 [Tanacetum coccineum]